MIRGKTETILCLGNGPSSEDPGLAEIRYDALFRVNHSWIARGLYAKPNVVFTGARKSMRAVRNAIFGVQTRAGLNQLGLANALDPTQPKTRIFCARDLADPVDAFDWGTARPTNGAVMLAVAVALAPRYLAVAGIDLFRHPEGSYPGDRETPNSYIAGHDGDAELNFILGLFEAYNGELVIFGDILRAEWDRHSSRLGAQAQRGQRT